MMGVVGCNICRAIGSSPLAKVAINSLERTIVTNSSCWFFKRQHTYESAMVIIPVVAGK